MNYCVVGWIGALLLFYLTVIYFGSIQTLVSILVVCTICVLILWWIDELGWKPEEEEKKGST